ncbi:MAG TPA: response regulator transcription factor [Solirubrobacteraceae bacterium]|jgi:two-component system OmpR family response regulator|nr:response regulator transcription factor [Solirubrobacteraceae bacterium]
MRVLVVEDRPKLARLLTRVLRGEGMAADAAETGEEALWMAQATRYEAVILDVMLPGIDGIEVCRELRAREIWSPILLLTARAATDDRVAGLDAGADDYLVKPFRIPELLARLRALVRRSPAPRPAVLEVGELRLDPATREAWRAGRALALQPKCFALLEAFMREPGVVLSRLHLLESAWDSAYENRSNVVDQHVRTLRDAIDRPFGRASIETVRGGGYRLRRDGG